MALRGRGGIAVNARGEHPTVCFVTYELAPINPGGCGTYITQIIPKLAGHLRVLVLAGVGAQYTGAYGKRGLHDPRGTGINAVFSRDELAPAPAGAPENAFIRNTHRFAEALRRLCESTSVDLIELPEYAGIAYGAIKLKRQHGWFQDQRLIVRLHGSIELIDYHEGRSSFTLQRRMIYLMERYALRNADILIAPSRGTFDDYRDYYRLDRDPVIASPPLARLLPVPGAGSGTTVLCVGRLQAIKGVDLFVRAALRWLEAGGPPDVKFVVVGIEEVPGQEGFGWAVKAAIPPKLQRHFDFLGHRTVDEIRALAAHARFAVVPSRWESFGYVARELLAFGLPLVVSCIAAFRELGQCPAVSLFDGSVDDLAQAMARRWTADRSASPTMPAVAIDYGRLYAELAAGKPAGNARPSDDVGARVLRLERSTVPLVDGDAPGNDPVESAPTASHRVLADWLYGQRERIVAVALPDWDGDARSLQAAAAYVAEHADIAAVECLPRYVAPALASDPEAPLLAVSEGDEIARTVFGLVPTVLVFRAPGDYLELLPGPPRALMRQLLQRLGRSGEIELAWPCRWSGQTTFVPGDGLLGDGDALLGHDATTRWALGYLRHRVSTSHAPREPGRTWEPGYWARRSWQVLRDEGPRAYLRKVRRLTRRFAR
jgi:glycosyltransferase involved in cell wall biosynthesis